MFLEWIDDYRNPYPDGAEDYMTKPFSTKELLVRVGKIILRHNKNTNIKVKDICFDLDKMIVLKTNKTMKLYCPNKYKKLENGEYVKRNPETLKDILIEAVSKESPT